MMIDLKPKGVEDAIESILLLVDSQADDSRLWKSPATSDEEYLQYKLRRLHGLIEHEFKK